MRRFFIYLKEHLGAIAVFALCIIFYTAAFALYHLPVEAVLYPSVLSLVLVFLYSIYNFIKKIKKHRELKRLRALPENLLDCLSIYNNNEDEDYKAVISLLLQREKRKIEEQFARSSDAADYYTTWAHQIKTPIASMKLSLQGEDSPLSRRLSDDLFRIEQYVEMVMCYIRLDDSSSDYLFREYPLDKIVKASVRRLAALFIGKGIKLEYKVVDGIKVLTDEKWLSFVIEQILTNALKYTTDGSISIYTDGFGNLCISDTGTGISSADLPRIFEKGYTGERGRADMQASGLGLYLCRSICERLGHGISAESESGKGTTVRLCLSHSNARHE